MPPERAPVPAVDFSWSYPHDHSTSLMPVKPRRPLPRMSSKKLSEVGPQWSTITTKGKKPNVRNRKRHAKEWTRAYGSPERVAFVKGLPCCACGNGPSENAHTAGGGGSRKADAVTIAPACHRCHRFVHAQGWTRLEIEFGFDREQAAAQCEAAWRAHNGEES